MKIIILAAAALVATTLSAAAAHDEGHDDGVLGTPGWTNKVGIGEEGGTVDFNNERGLVATVNVIQAAPLVSTDEGIVSGTRMPDGTVKGEVENPF
jgi:hypothetical protein